MIGYYDYSMLLTYLSLISAGTGIFLSLSGGGHPYLGIFCLLACGLMDAFDGRVARSKKDRTDMQCKYGIQIDSLADLVAFGVLPACIGGAIMRSSQLMQRICQAGVGGMIITGILYAILVLFIVAAMIRLAYFNVTEEERQKTETGCRKFYLGLPVTAISLIAPLTIFFGLVFKGAVIAYFAVIFLVGILFILPIRVPKPGLRGILIMICCGSAEFIVLAILYWMRG